MAINLNVRAGLATPFFVERLIHQKALMKQVRGSAGCAHDFADARERTIRLDDCDIWRRENVLAGAQLETRYVSAVLTERSRVTFVEAVEAKIVVKQEPRVVGKNTL